MFEAQNEKVIQKKGSGIHISKSGAIYCQRRHRHTVNRVYQNQMCERSKVIQNKNETTEGPANAFVIGEI